MKYDFDQITDRRNTNSIKYDFFKERGKSKDQLPLWVADMDFKTAPEITEALEGITKHGIFGYSQPREKYYEAVLGWYKNNFGWEAKRDWIVKTPGVVFAIAQAIRAYTKEGEGVIIQQPVYYPFYNSIIDNNRRAIINKLKEKDGSYEIDFEDFERKASEDNTKLFILCSPHNPVGRVWKAEELKKLADICLKHNVVIFSDEIHSDFIWDDNRHHILVDLDESYKANVITATSPSKSFNLAGLQISNIFVPDQGLRTKLKTAIAKTGYDECNIYGLAACTAAYSAGKDWLDEARKYIRENIAYFTQYINDEIPGVSAHEPEGTYLVWVDFRKLGLNDDELLDLIDNRAKLWLDDGPMFGTGGSGFARFNVACPKSILEKALENLKKAVKNM